MDHWDRDLTVLHLLLDVISRGLDFINFILFKGRVSLAEVQSMLELCDGNHS